MTVKPGVEPRLSCSDPSIACNDDNMNIFYAENMMNNPRKG
jgi:hypothetical protein